jgi:primosomal protein N' (replication factor Y)
MGGHEESDGLSGQNMTLFAEVILSLPLDKAFLYIVPDSEKDRVGVGSRVLVPFKERMRTGIVVRLRKRGVPEGLKLKDVHAVLDESPLLSKDLLSFTKKLSGYFYSSWGELLQASLPPSLAPKTKATYSITDKGKMALDAEKLSGRERTVLQFLKERPYSDVYLKRKLKIRDLSPVLFRLGSRGFIQEKKEVKTETRRRSCIASQSPTQLEMDFSLDEDSYQAASSIVSGWDEKTSSFYYLFGPSEKREAVYFYLIKRALTLKKRILYLVPEIATTRDLLEKFQKRFGENAALLHSRMSARSREAVWEKIHSGRADVVLGPRSAVLSPVRDLGIVILDEEQDESYFQKENPSYDARIGARLRARQDRAVLVYGSAAPTVESYFEFKKTKRLYDIFGVSKQSHAEIIKHRSVRGLLSPQIIDRLRKAIQENKSVLVFHFRRGYASYIACSRCSYSPRCPECDIALAYHRRDDQLICHYCGHSLQIFAHCPECGHKIIKKRGFGIEAVEEEIRRLFPRSHVAGFDSDAVKSPKDQEKFIGLFEKKKIDIMVGTQMLARQQTLSKAPLVVILYPETILALPDFRASQKAYQSIIQASALLSADENSELLIQTAFPDHFSIRSAAQHDYAGFYTQEIKYRRLMNYPPFTHMAEVLFFGENLRSVAKQTREFSAMLKDLSEDVEVLGPALAAVSRLRGKSRVQIFLKSKKREDLDRTLRHALAKVRANKKVFVYY